VNKTEMLKAVAQKAEITQKDAEKAMAAVFAVIEQALVDEDRIQIIGFGTFETRTREARKGRNPRTKEEIDIPASKHPVFKPGKSLKEVVNQKNRAEN